MRELREIELGTVGELSTSTPRTEPTARQMQLPGKWRTMCRQGMHISDHGVQLVSKGEVETRDIKEGKSQRA